MPSLRRPRLVLAVTAAAATAVVVVPLAPTVASALSGAGQATEAALLVPAQNVVPGGAPELVWPATGRARLEVAGLGTMGEVGDSTEWVPIASITKVMTAYTVLSDHPLKPGKSGPRLKVTKRDVRAYKQLQAEGVSVVKVKAGQKLNQKQALQGLLMQSGSNLGPMLARWDAGSQTEFIAKMNANAQKLGLDSTSYADATGLSIDSRSSAEDLLDLARAAMKKPVFAEIVGSRTARIPFNDLKSTNKLLGSNGVIGIKTGTSWAAGGCLLFAATDKVGGRTQTIYGVVLGANGPHLGTAAQVAAKKLIISVRAELKPVTLVKRGKALVTVTKPDGTVVNLGVAKTVKQAGWSGLPYQLSLPSGLRPGQTPDQLFVKAGARKIGVALERLG